MWPQSLVTKKSFFGFLEWGCAVRSSSIPFGSAWQKSRQKASALWHHRKITDDVVHACRRAIVMMMVGRSTIDDVRHVTMVDGKLPSPQCKPLWRSRIVMDSRYNEQYRPSPEIDHKKTWVFSKMQNIFIQTVFHSMILMRVLWSRWQVHYRLVEQFGVYDLVWDTM